ncbi:MULTISPECIES: hypothetical protein [Streptomyces]|uniref:Tat pathway signal sequence domain protein n=1 Tax=Streptomyces dengpaensis TaxID=2049881 RepID=A0ABN5I8J4_9ACTN|nr:MULTISPECIES: hypothetical protein [Streptomyces]AVH59319.1 hypothetical protein C4B68_30240 [Streptomyces dengpaensis]PIB00319.1 hypothetical protein B1C81_38485 [Streptomyces sp. HG99]
MTGIGPVEPYHPDDTDGPHQNAPTDLLWSKSSPATARWAALPRSRRRIAQALIVAAAATAAFFALRPAPATQATPNPYPWPAGVTTLHYQGRAPTPLTYRFTVDVARGSPVTIHQIGAGLPTLRATTTPPLPLTVKTGSPRLITVSISVYKCADLPPALELPHLDLLFSNKNSQQQQSFVFGGTYPHHLWTDLRAHCFPHQGSPAPTSPARDPWRDLTRR